MINLIYKKIVVERDTVLKPSTREAVVTRPEDLYTLKKGQSFDCIRIVEHLNHYCLDLREAIQGHQRWYAFMGHCYIEEPKPSVATPIANKEVLVKGVPFFAQYDNRYKPNTSCFLTSAAMIMAYHGIKPLHNGVQLEDELYQYAIKGGLNRFAGEHVAQVIKDYGLNATYSTKRSFQDIKDQLNKGNPCTLGVYSTFAGHIICIIGYDDTKKHFICHDPWGRWLGTRGDYDFNHSGEMVYYSYSDLGREASPESPNNPSDCWSTFISKK